MFMMYLLDKNRTVKQFNFSNAVRAKFIYYHWLFLGCQGPIFVSHIFLVILVIWHSQKWVINKRADDTDNKAQNI